MSDVKKQPRRPRWDETDTVRELAEHVMRVWAALSEAGAPLYSMSGHERRCCLAAYRVTRTMQPEKLELLRHVFRHKRRFWTTPDAICDTAREYSTDENELRGLVRETLRGIALELLEFDNVTSNAEEGD